MFGLFPKLVKTVREFPLKVNYDRSIEDARIAGNYDVEDSSITSENFPTTRTGTADLTLCLVSFDSLTIGDEAFWLLLERLEKIRHAETHELLALGAAYPELQREGPIIALGSVVWHPYRYHCVPYLRGDGSRRSLGHYTFDDNKEWLPGFRFAAVRTP